MIFQISAIEVNDSKPSNKRSQPTIGSLKLITLSQRKMPIFYIEIDDKIFVYRLKGTEKFTFIAICMTENFLSKCKVQPSED